MITKFRGTWANSKYSNNLKRNSILQMRISSIYHLTLIRLTTDILMGYKLYLDWPLFWSLRLYCSLNISYFVVTLSGDSVWEVIITCTMNTPLLHARCVVTACNKIVSDATLRNKDSVTLVLLIADYRWEISLNQGKIFQKFSLLWT